jgi:uncharacterized membrane protein YcaP (DUF421 family)
LTQDDLYDLLRQHGIVELSQVRLVVFEQRGKVSAIKSAESDSDAELLRKVRAQTPQAV